MIEIIIRGDKKEDIHAILDRLSDNETFADCLDDLAGDMNTVKMDMKLWKENTVKEMWSQIEPYIKGKNDNKPK